MCRTANGNVFWSLAGISLISLISLVVPGHAAIIPMDERNPSTTEIINGAAGTVIGNVLLCEGAVAVGGNSCPSGSSSDILIFAPGGTQLSYPTTTGNIMITFAGSADTITARLFSDQIVVGEPSPGGDIVANATDFPRLAGSPLLFIPETIIIVNGVTADGAMYTPMAGQPGFLQDANNTYQIVSDVPPDIPEPSTLFLLCIGLAALAVASRVGIVCDRRPTAC